MLQYFETLQDESGNALPGATAKVLNWPSLTNATIYATNGTATPLPFNTATADATAQISFYVPDGAYQIQYTYNGALYKTKAPVQMIDPMGLVAIADTGSVNAYTITDSRLPANLIVGMKVLMQATHANTAAATFNMNGTGAQPITTTGLTALLSGALANGGQYLLVWDGTEWQVLGGLSTFVPALGSVTDASLASSSVIYALDQTYLTITAAEIAAGVTPPNLGYAPGVDLRYGVVRDGVTDNSTALQNWLNVGGQAQKLYATRGNAAHTTTLLVKNNTTIEGFGRTNTTFTYSGTSDQWRSANPINASTASNIKISDINLVATNPSAGAANYTDVGSTFLTFINVGFHGAAIGLILDQSEIVRVMDCDVEVINTASAIGVWIANGPGHTPALTFTAGLAALATSGTLTGNFTAGPTGIYNIAFVETVGGAQESRAALLTNGSTAVSWFIPLVAACNAATTGASNAFTNQLIFDGCQFNGTTAGVAHVVDDGGVNHVFRDCNFDGCQQFIRVADVRNFLVYGGEYEFSSTAGITFNTTLLNGAVSPGQTTGAIIRGASVAMTSTQPFVTIGVGTLFDLDFITNVVSNTGTVLSGVNNCTEAHCEGNLQLSSGDGYLVMNNYFEENTTFVPVWSSSGTQPAIGNGTIAMQVSRKGKQVMCRSIILMGSTTTFGTGTYFLSIPYTAGPTVGTYGTGDAIQAADNMLICKINSNGTLIESFTTAASALVGAAVPGAWANTHHLEYTIIYTAANLVN